MTTIISGQSGLALTLAGDAITVTTVDGQSFASTPRMIPVFLGGASDITRVDDPNETHLLDLLRVSWQFDRAILMMLITLDPEEELDTRSQASLELEELLIPEGVSERIADRICSWPLPNIASPVVAIEIGLRAKKILNEALANQELIADYWSTWETIGDELFEPIGRDRFRALLVGHGVIGQLVRRRDSRLQFDAARINAINIFSQVPNARRIVQELVRNHVPDIRTDTGATRGARPELEEENVRRRDSRREVPGWQLKENVDIQKREIERCILKGDLAWVRRLVSELVASQLQSSETKFAAMSLTDLANVAKDIENHSLQCELAEQAVQLVPDDPKAVGQLGDALLRLGRIDDARTEFARALALGSVEFGRIGAARVLRVQNRLAEAAKEFERIVVDFPKSFHGLAGLAEVYRELWQYDDALATYDRGIAVEPEIPSLWCGRAAVLADMGRLTESLQAYADADRRFMQNVVAKCGRAHVLFLAGQMESSLAAYEELVIEASGYSVAWCGRSEVLKELGNFGESLRGYADAIERFPWSSVAWCGRAETFKEMKQFDSALATYDEALERFPFESRIYNGRANVLRRCGKLSAALQSYDESISRFPIDLVANTGRANLLKELGRLDDALDAYDFVLTRSPRNSFARFSRAAILAVMGNIDAALEALPKTAPQTRDDWIGWHIRGMSLLRADRISDGVRVLTEGADQCPFAREREHFKRALVVTELRNRRFRSARQLIGDDNQPILEVLRIHTHGALREFSDAKRAYNRIENIELPPYLTELRSQLGKRYGLEPGRMTMNWDWIFREECRAILLAA